MVGDHFGRTFVKGGINTRQCFMRFSFSRFPTKALATLCFHGGLPAILPAAQRSGQRAEIVLRSRHCGLNDAAKTRTSLSIAPPLEWGVRAVPTKSVMLKRRLKTFVGCGPSTRAKVMDGIEEHLTLQPSQQSKSRIKAMAQPFWSQYRLRVDDFRVYFDVDEEGHTVNVLCVLKKGTRRTPQAPS